MAKKKKSAASAAVSRLDALLAQAELQTRSGRLNAQGQAALAAIIPALRAAKAGDPAAQRALAQLPEATSRAEAVKPEPNRLQLAGISGPAGQLAMIPQGSSFMAERARLLRGGWGPGGYAFGSR